MEKHDIRNIIKKFHKGNFSEPSRRKFAWWLISSGDEDNTKTDTLRELWEESVGSVDEKTLEDLDKIKVKIQHSNSKSKKWWYVAASLLFLTVLSIGYYYFACDSKMAQESEIVVVNAPYGDIMKLILEDNTEVILNAGSSLVYPRQFSKEKRNVFLSGEASFDVTKDSQRPFTVETSSFNVTALGTKFEVDAYSDSKSASTTLFEGKTKIVLNQTYNSNNEKDYILEPNQHLLVNKSTGKVTISTVDPDRALSWTNGDLIFEGASFSKILSSLERKFGVVFVCEHIELMGGSYYVKFRSDESVTEALDILRQLSHHYNYRMVSDTIFIYPTQK